MITWVENENYETPKQYNLVVGYYRGKSIIKDELGTLYYLECEESCAPIGTAIEPEMLNSIEKLRAEEQEVIEKIYAYKAD